MKLIAFDVDDLAVLSTHVEGACVRASDMAYLPKEKRFALVASRCCREEGEEGANKQRPFGMHFENVLKVSSQGVKFGSDETLQLLALTFEGRSTPAGTLTLHFESNARLRLEVECLEAVLRDLDETYAPLTPARAGAGVPLSRE